MCVMIILNIKNHIFVRLFFPYHTVMKSYRRFSLCVLLFCVDEASLTSTCRQHYQHYYIEFSNFSKSSQIFSKGPFVSSYHIITEFLEKKIEKVIHTRLKVYFKFTKKLKNNSIWRAMRCASAFRT